MSDTTCGGKKSTIPLFRHKGTTIPRWIASKWELEKYFPDANGSLGKKDKNSETTILLKNKTYTGNLTCSFPSKRANKVHRLWLSEELTDELKRDFVMSHMRDIESALRGNVGDLEKEIPFWEFVDIEFDPDKRRFILTSLYKHEPLFPELFKCLAGSPALKSIDDHISGNKGFRIHKQDWRPKENIETEIGAMNTIYMLLDKKISCFMLGKQKTSENV